MTLVLELPAEVEIALHERARERGISVEELALEYLREFLAERKSAVLRIHNIAAIEARGGYICRNDDFQLVCCSICGCHYLYNAEIFQLYLDPNDLSRVILDIEGEQWPPCRCCGALNWNVRKLTNANVLPKNQEDWAWLFNEDEK